MADLPPTTRIVVTPNPVGVGQSIGGPGTTTNSNLNQPTYNIADLSPNGPNPAQALDGVNPSSQLNVWRFPSDTPPYYLSLAVNDYSRASWVSVGQLHETDRIILPLPQQMIDNANVRYEISDIGIAGAVGFDTISGAYSQAVGQAVTGAVGAALNGAAGQLGAAGQAGKKAFNGALGAAGLAVNDFLTVMLRSPDYKRRDFVWRFSPKSAQETYDLRRIIQLINNSMAPSLTGVGSSFFAWPKIFKPEFVYNGNPELLALNTFRMKPSVVTDFNINYSPNGNFSPFASTKAPTSVEIHMTLLELELWLRGNYDDVPSNLPGASSNQVINNIINVNIPSGASFNGVGTGAVTP